MPQSSWSKVLNEVRRESEEGRPGVDIVRQKKLQRVCRLTGHPLIVYAVACTIPNQQIPPRVLMMDASDKLAFHDVTENLKDHDAVDVMLHSPGGLPEAAEGLVGLLRDRFETVRFIVPTYAKSAATMLALSGDEILMYPDAELGPTDPQFLTAQGASPAQAIIDQFEKARKAVADNPGDLPVWLPILNQMGPSLLQQCETALKLSRELVTTWLATYMFKGDEDGEEKATKIAQYLSDHRKFKSHARGVGLPLLQELGVNARAVPKRLRVPIWEAYCAVDITFSNSTAARLVENNLGDRIIRNYGAGQVAFQLPIKQAPSDQPTQPDK